jgi:transmembrane sensor
MTSNDSPRRLATEVERIRGDLQDIDLPAGSYSRLLRRRRGRAVSPRVAIWRWSLAGAGALLAALVIVWWSTGARTTVLGGFEVAERSVSFLGEETRDGGIRVARGDGVLVVAELATRLAVHAGSELQRRGKAVRVLAGTVDVDVQPRVSPAEPVQFVVSHGRIEVLGTKFTIVQQDMSGYVTLHTGTIRFIAPSGNEVLLHPSQTLVWPMPEPNPQPSAQPRPPPVVRPRPMGAARQASAARASAPTRVDADALLADLEDLRIRGQYAAMADRIEAALASIDERDVQESLSYELCDIIVRRLNETARGCRLLADYLKMFPQGRYVEDVKQRLTALHCPAW